MPRILAVEWLAPDVKRLVLEAPGFAHRVAPGQFLVLRVRDPGERVPLMIADSDPAAGSVGVVVDGRTPVTRTLLGLGAGGSVCELIGPLGQPSEIRAFGTVVVIGGGLGAAVALPVARALRAAGNAVIGILGARTRSGLILEPQWRAVTDELAVMTDDGSAGEWGLVSTALQRLLDTDPRVDRIVASGSLAMLRAIAAITRPLEIPTRVSLDALLADGIGLCGDCLVKTTAGPQFVCLDGPEFDAQSLDFSELSRRLTARTAAAHPGENPARLPRPTPPSPANPAEPRCDDGTPPRCRRRSALLLGAGDGR